MRHIYLKAQRRQNSHDGTRKENDIEDAKETFFELFEACLYPH